MGGLWWHEHTPEIFRVVLAAPFGLFKVLAYKKVRKACGLDKCTLLYTGAAPLSEATQRYLRSLDMPLLEVFGMSESCGAIGLPSRIVHAVWPSAVQYTPSPTSLPAS